MQSVYLLGYGEMAVDFEIDVSGLADLAGKVGSKEFATRMNKEIGVACAEITADHIASKVSPTHHKTADRLGAVHSGFFEFARGREGFYQGKDRRDGNGAGFIESRDADPEGVSVVIGNTPGMSRAFHALDIKPKKSKFLTIPIHRDSYSLRVKDVEAMRPGIKIFRVTNKKGTNILIGSEGSGKEKKTRPLYVLVKSVRIPQDRGLLPDRKAYEEAALDVAEAMVEVEAL